MPRWSYVSSDQSNNATENSVPSTSPAILPARPGNQDLISASCKSRQTSSLTIESSKGVHSPETNVNQEQTTPRATTTKKVSFCELGSDSDSNKIVHQTLELPDVRIHELLKPVDEMAVTSSQQKQPTRNYFLRNMSRPTSSHPDKTVCATQRADHSFQTVVEGTPVTLCCSLTEPSCPDKQLVGILKRSVQAGQSHEVSMVQHGHLPGSTLTFLQPYPKSLHNLSRGASPNKTSSVHKNHSRTILTNISSSTLPTSVCSGEWTEPGVDSVTQVQKKDTENCFVQARSTNSSSKATDKGIEPSLTVGESQVGLHAELGTALNPCNKSQQNSEIPIDNKKIVQGKVLQRNQNNTRRIRPSLERARAFLDRQSTVNYVEPGDEIQRLAGLRNSKRYNSLKQSCWPDSLLVSDQNAFRTIHQTDSVHEHSLGPIRTMGNSRSKPARKSASCSTVVDRASEKSCNTIAKARKRRRAGQMGLTLLHEGQTWISSTKRKKRVIIPPKKTDLLKLGIDKLKVPRKKRRLRSRRVLRSDVDGKSGPASTEDFQHLRSKFNNVCTAVDSRPRKKGSGLNHVRRRNVKSGRVRTTLIQEAVKPLLPVTAGSVNVLGSTDTKFTSGDRRFASGDRRFASGDKRLRSVPRDKKHVVKTGDLKPELPTAGSSPNKVNKKSKKYSKVATSTVKGKLYQNENDKLAKQNIVSIDPDCRRRMVTHITSRSSEVLKQPGRRSTHQKHVSRTQIKDVGEKAKDTDTLSKASPEIGSLKVSTNQVNHNSRKETRPSSKGKVPRRQQQKGADKSIEGSVLPKSLIVIPCGGLNKGAARKRHGLRVQKRAVKSANRKDTNQNENDKERTAINHTCSIKCILKKDDFVKLKSNRNRCSAAKFCQNNSVEVASRDIKSLPSSKDGKQCPHQLVNQQEGEFGQHKFPNGLVKEGNNKCTLQQKREDRRPPLVLGWRDSPTQSPVVGDFNGVVVKSFARDQLSPNMKYMLGIPLLNTHRLMNVGGVHIMALGAASHKQTTALPPKKINTQNI